MLGPLNTLVQSDTFDAEFAQRCQLTFNRNVILAGMKLSALLYLIQCSLLAMTLLDTAKSEIVRGNVTLTQC